VDVPGGRARWTCQVDVAVTRARHTGTTMEDALAGLDDEQRAAAMVSCGPVCIIAGAGTGKTRTVTHRLAYGVQTGEVDPGSALAVTHSRKAAAELGERMRVMGVHGVDGRTFHSAALWVVKRFWALTGRAGPAPNVLGEREEWRLWRDSLRDVNGYEPDVAEVREVLDEVGWARSRLVPMDDYPAASLMAGRHSDKLPEDVVRSWRRFTERKTGAGRVDFSDLLEIAAALIEQQLEAAQSVRRRWSHVTVDEYQDTDPLQQRLLDAILGSGRDICVVGDPRQAIYSWKGADPTFLTGFVRRYPEATVFKLSYNYRSSPQILGWANRLARGQGTKPLQATKSSGPMPTFRQFDDEQTEAASIASAAKRAISGGTPASEIAVLYRYNATQARFEAALARAGVPAVVAEDVTFFDRDEVRAVLVPFGRAARVEPGRHGVELLLAQLTRAGFNPDRPPAGFGAVRARWESQQALLELIEALPGAEAMDAKAMLAEVNELALSTHGPRHQGVTLSTLHKAKGLEWDLVYLVSMSDGAMPSVFADTEAELQEEERLLHVGITRARRQVQLSWASIGAKGRYNQPSPYLDLLSEPKRSRPHSGRGVKRSPVAASNRHFDRRR
jgi:DNA helicase II / ATP-dependent DNA helicase PcrA